jgi:hypothetical protein
VYGGGGGEPAAQGEVALVEHHLLLAVPVVAVDKSNLVELWPTPASAIVGFFGCDISVID